MAQPSFVYGAHGSPGTLKLNGALATLPLVRDGAFVDSGLRVSLRPVGAPHARARRHGGPT